MQTLDLKHYLTLREHAEVLEADHSGEKVLRLDNGSVLKIFRRKRLITSALLYPYARRFADNARELAKRGIVCPRILGVYRIKKLRSDVVNYAPIPGQTLREALDNSTDRPALLAKLGRFLARLHETGVYFRSAHLGNIILMPDGKLGLIDFADLRAYSRPLHRSMRMRNFSHVLRLAKDRKRLLGDGNGAFVESYLQAQHACTAEHLAAILA